MKLSKHDLDRMVSAELNKRKGNAPSVATPADSHKAIADMVYGRLVLGMETTQLLGKVTRSVVSEAISAGVKPVEY